MKDLQDLFRHFVRDMYYAEKKILKTLPKMARKASDPELREAFEHHQAETETQVERLEKVFDSLGMAHRGVTCEAIEGILEEGSEIMQETDEGKALDAGMIAAAQAVEHYEIARYGTLLSWARELGHDDAARLIAETLEEEKSADKKLTDIGESSLNREAA